MRTSFNPKPRLPKRCYKRGVISGGYVGNALSRTSYGCYGDKEHCGNYYGYKNGSHGSTFPL